MAVALLSLHGFEKLRELPDSGRRVLGRLTETVLDHLPTWRHTAPPDAPAPAMQPLAPLASGAERAIAEATIAQLLREIPDSAVLAVIDAAACLPLAVVSASENPEVVGHAAAEVAHLAAAKAAAAEADSEAVVLSPMGLAVQFARIVKRIDAMSRALGTEQEALTEVIIPTAQLLHVVRMVGNGRWHLYAALPADRVNMALVSTLLAAAAADLTATMAAVQ